MPLKSVQPLRSISDLVRCLLSFSSDNEHKAVYLVASSDSVHPLIRHCVLLVANMLPSDAATSVRRLILAHADIASQLHGVKPSVCIASLLLPS